MRGDGALRWRCKYAQTWAKVRCGGGVGLVKCGRGGTVVEAGDGMVRAVCSGHIGIISYFFLPLSVEIKEKE